MITPGPGRGRSVTARCRACGAPVRWVRTTGGKLMPLDPDPDPAGLVELDDQGHAIVHGQPTLTGGNRWTAHFATCPSWPAR